MKKIIFVISFILISSCSSSSNSEKERLFPTYGNYCGVDLPKSGTNPMPIDMTDFSCKEHDECYEEKLYSHKSCDRELIKDLKRVQPQNGAEKLTQKSIYSYLTKPKK